MKASFVTLGCKVNQYESQAIAAALGAEGYEITEPGADTDVFVVNSCTVTAESDRKTRQTVRRLRRLNPAAVVVLTGCMPQAFPEDAVKLTEADVITGNKFNHEIPDLIRRFRSEGRVLRLEPHKSGEPFIVTKVTSFHDRTRANLKIEDGCDRFCSYCAIPYARGRVRSKPLEAIREEAQALALSGYREIVLVGINLSAYGKGTEFTITDAVKAAAEPEGILRVRLGSLEPDHITDEVIAGLSSVEKFCPQFHISLQSGCDNTLKRMNRHYTAAEYADLCRKLRAAFPDTTLTTDVMVGFSGETEEDFEASLEFVKEIGFEKVHVFPYSVRPGTAAEKLTGKVQKAEKERRAAIMAEEADKIRHNFLLSQVGKVLEIIPEERLSDGTVHGYTANYIPVAIPADKAVFGRIIKVKITGAEADRCVGETI